MSEFASLPYLDGFGSFISSEALPGSLPIGQNSPQVCPRNLYAEQLSGTAFTAPRHKNMRSWLYRIKPSVTHSRFEPHSVNGKVCVREHNLVVDPNQLRWDPKPLPTENIDFIDGIELVCGAGDSSLKDGVNIYNYVASSNMSSTNRVLSNADGDYLIVPQHGTLNIRTEMGLIRVEPCEIVVIPRGIKFAVDIEEVGGCIRGYILETCKGHFELPSLGPIGANGLANPRDFLAPSAAFQDITAPFTWINKFACSLFVATLDHSPFDVVGWHGNYYPFKYDLRRFNCMNSVTFDHPDPSIYTVLTCPSDELGTAVVDFVIFPPRWIVMDHTFRPPYFHRNCMSEYMGMIYGKYDAKEGGFVPGGASLHSCMTPHGPDTPTFIKASEAELTPTYFDGGLAFMFETSYVLKLAPAALSSPQLQRTYNECWQQLPKLFNPSP